MDKNKKNSLIIVVVILLVFVFAYLGYDQLSKNGPNTSYAPQININEDKISSLEQESKAISQSTTNSDNNKTESQNSDTQQVAANDDNGEAEVSNIMPDIPLTLLNGEETTFWKLAELGKPVVINSFASWCPPCKQEMPEFIEASEEYKGRVTFIFFDSFDGERETKEALDAFAKEYFNDDTICVIDPGYISYLFKSNSLPTTILLNKKGEPVNGFQGMIQKETLVGAIEQLLSE